MIGATYTSVRDKYMVVSKEYIQISTVKTIVAVVLFVLPAFLYITNLSERSALQAQTLESHTKDIEELQSDSKYLIRLVERMAERSNIDIERVRTEVENKILTENK